jgi:23S rRNA (uracil1939-C5)-methyltransferase
MTSPSEPVHMQLSTTAVVAGGDALARAEDGRVVFVEEALPDETLSVEVVAARRDHLRARVVEIVTPSAARVEPPCLHHREGCGGCPWQHVDAAAQPVLKQTIVEDALRRIAHIEDVSIATITLPTTGYRTTVRALVVDGRPAFRRRHAHDPIPIEHCLVAHPLVDEVLADGHFGTAQEIVVRAGVATGERLVLADPVKARLRLPDDVRTGARAQIHEIVEGRTFRISARSFFQSRPDGAAALARVVRDAVGPQRAVADLYSGVGLLGALLDQPAKVIAVEGSRSAAADARANLAHLPASVVHGDVRRWRPEPVDVVIADPGRSGLQRAGVKVVSRSVPERVVLVSCDAAALARDARLLGDDGYALRDVTMLDMFGHTPHVECVSVFERAR